MRLPNSVPEMNVMDDGCSLYFCTLMMSLYVSCGLFISDSPKILSVMKLDKKADGEDVNFVFTSGFSKAFIKKVSLETIFRSL